MQRIHSQHIDNPDYVYPRTLDEAFGSRGPVIEKDADLKMDRQDKVVLWAAPAAVIFLIVLFAFES